MLNIVPNFVNRSNRLVVTKHPNAIDASIYERVLNRTGSPSVGGVPTIGGIGSTSTEDEADISYVLRGAAKVVMLQPLYAGSRFNDRDDSVEAIPAQEFMIESVIGQAQVGGFVVEDRDMVLLKPGGNIIVAYEVVKVLNTVDIPPFTRKYLCESRDELLYIPAVAAEIAAKP